MNTTTNDITNTDIRDYLDHGHNTRRVRVKRTGEVMIKGSATVGGEPTVEGWLFWGWREEAVKQLEAK